MSDQADMLRKIVSMKAGNQKPELKPKDEKITKKARVITITSGKAV